MKTTISLHKTFYLLVILLGAFYSSIPLYSQGSGEEITLDVPNGYEIWTIGSKQNIIWHTQNYSGPVKIEYSTDGGASYTVIENSYSGSQSYEWTIPDTPSKLCAVKIADPNDYNPFDISDAVFTISANTTNNTPSGQHVIVELGGNHKIHFYSVTQEGNTELIIVPEGPPAQLGQVVFPAVSPFYYNISTTANYEDTIEVTINYDDAGILEKEDESQLNLFVYNEEGEEWDLITTLLDTIDNFIGGLVTHLSTFAIMLPAETEEPLEYVVTNTQDSGEGSFRQALLDAAGDTGIASVIFNIPKADPGFNADTGIWTIALQSSLTGISGNHIIIDGISQSAYIGEDTNPLGPEIEISGKLIGDIASGLYINQCNIEIFHLIINRFKDAGLFLSNLHFAIIAGCYIGTGHDGWENAGNRVGIYVSDNCKNVHIVPLDTIPNVIGGNEYGGISFQDSCTHNLISGNIIGLTRDHQEVIGETNGHGIQFWGACDSNTVTDNWIGGNVNGIGIYGSNDNVIAGNRIGTDPEWTLDLGNSWDGIEIMQGSERNKIIGNFIGNNSRDGVRVYGSESMYNTISENSISENESNGIYLMNGANGGLAAPKITSMNGHEISGTTLPMSLVEIFTDADDEGRIIQAAVWSDADGNFAWPGPVEGPFDSIRATVTDSLGNTSEFGKSVPGKDPTSIESLDPVSFTLSNNYPNPNHPEMQITFNLPASIEVSLDVFDLSGVKVYEIHKGKLQTGRQSLSWNTSQHASGVYLIRMQTLRGVLTRKCVVLK
ncbi:MAG: right-handed parallel beta-helix repeat-containing protein [Bacteroidales bacterium]